MKCNRDHFVKKADLHTQMCRNVQHSLRACFILHALCDTHRSQEAFRKAGGVKKSIKKKSEEQMKRKAQSQSLSCDSVNAAALTYLDIGALSHERVLQTKVQVGLTVQGGREVKDVH